MNKQHAAVLDVDFVALAKERHAQLASEIASARNELRRESLREDLFRGLSDVGAEQHAAQFADAPANCERLRRDLGEPLRAGELERKRMALAAAIDFLTVKDVELKRDELGAEIEAANHAVESYPDRERIARLKSRLGANHEAARNGIVTMGSENLAEAVARDPKLRKQLAEYDALVSKVVDLTNRAGGFGAAIQEISQKYGDLADIMVG